jgi:hypothetical protein
MSTPVKAFEDALRKASGNSYADFQRKGELAFWGEVAQKINSKQRYSKARVATPTSSLAFLIFEGTDSSDITLEGHAGLVLLDSNTIKVFVSSDSVYRGRGENEQTFKSGVLTTELVADMVLEFIVRR